MTGGRGGNPNAWRQRQAEKKRVEKAATLRKYAKLCKKEGIKSDRVRIKGEAADAAPPKKAVKKSTNVIEEAAQLAQQRAQEKEKEKERQRKEKLREVEAALHKRKEKRKLATAKNSKGQPLFKGKILNILERLQK